MKHFVYTINDNNNRPIEIRTVIVPNHTGSITVSPVAYDMENAAKAYKSQLEQIYGISQQPHRTPPKRKRVKSWKTGEIFPSAAAAARNVGVTTSAMTAHLRNPSKSRSVKNATFCWIDENGKEIYP